MLQYCFWCEVSPWLAEDTYWSSPYKALSQWLTRIGCGMFLVFSHKVANPISTGLGRA